MRQRFIYNVGGTLRFTPPQADSGGPPASATVTIKRASSNTDLPIPVVDQVAGVDGDDLTFTLVPANCPDPISTTGAITTLPGPNSAFIQPLYRAVWTYVVDGETYIADQLYEVRRRLLVPTLTVADILRRLPARPDELMGNESTEKILGLIGDTWDDLLDDLSSRGYTPDMIMDADRFRSVHRNLVLATLGATWGPDWRQWADDRRKDYEQHMADALTSDDWYDRDQSLTQAPGETRTWRIDCGR